MLQLFAEFIACLLAVFTFRKLDAFSKLLALQVVIALVVEITGWRISLHQNSNIWLYNIYMAEEVSVLFLATGIFFTRMIRMGMFAILICYLFGWFMELNYYNINSFALNTYVLGAIILIVTYSFLLYKSVWNRASLFRQSRFWFALGIILFFGCNIPFFSMHKFIAEHSTKSQMSILVDLMTTFAHIRYLCMAIGFWIEFKTKKEGSHQMIKYG